MDHCALIRVAGTTISQVFTNESLNEHPELSKAAVAYIDRFYRYDPNLRFVGDAARLRGKVLVRSVKPADIRQRAYRKLYEDSGIAHRISLLTGTQGQALVALNLYRVSGSGEFSDAEIARTQGGRIAARRDRAPARGAPRAVRLEYRRLAPAAQGSSA